MLQYVSMYGLVLRCKKERSPTKLYQQGLVTQSKSPGMLVLGQRLKSHSLISNLMQSMEWFDMTLESD